MKTRLPPVPFWRRFVPSAMATRLARLRSGQSAAALVGSLSVQAESLRQAGTALEQQFLNLGTVLEQLPPASAEMVRQCEQILALRGSDGTSGCPVEATMSFLRRSTEYLERYQSRMLDVVRRLRVVVVRIDELLGAEEELRRTVAPMKYVRTLLKIELSRLDASLQATFVTLADDIATMEGKLGDTFETRFGSLRAKRTIASDLLRQLETRLGEQAVLLSAKKQKINDGEAGFREEIVRSPSENARMADVSGSIAASVSQLVVGLQAQDIISQKLAHVVHALETMRQQLSSSDDGGRCGATLARQIRAVGMVEAAQLETIGDNLRQTEQVLIAALENVGEQTRTLEQHCEQSMTPVATRGPMPWDVLLDASREVRELLSDTVSGAERACDGFRPISNEATTVTVTIRDVSIQMRLIALNMQVQAALFGGQTGIEIIAGQTAAIAAQTDALGQRVASDMDLLSTGLAEMLSSCETLRREGQRQHATLVSTGLEREAVIHALRDKGLTRLLAAVTKVHVLTRSMRARVRLDVAAGGAVIAARAAIEPILAWCNGLGGSASDAVADAEAAATFQHTYTMESERAVHAAVLGGLRNRTVEKGASPAEAPPAAVAVVAAAGSTELGDNVELF